MHADPPQPAGVPQSEIPLVYRRIAWGYDLWAWLTEARARRRVVELAAIQDGESFLEIAVGTGLVFADLAQRNPHGRSAGLDLTPSMLERARRRVERLALVTELAIGDAHALSFPDGSFDLVASNYLFDLLPEGDFRPVLLEMRRVLRPAGRLVLANMAQGESWHHRFYEGLYRLRPALMGGCRGVALLPAVTAAGFGDARREYLTQFGFPTEVITARRSEP